MEKIKDLFQKILSFSKTNKNDNENKDHDPITEIKNWYSERYEVLLVQRNILFLFVIIAIASIFAGVFIIGNIAESKKIEPFIVEIEDKTGITNIVNPLTKKELLADTSLNTYFLMKYVRARETYNEVDYEYNYKTILRLLSSSKVYNEFWSNLNNNPKNPITTYGAANSTSLKLRSIQFLEPGKVAQIRFTITESAGQKNTYYKIATINFEYQTLELTNDERQVNPLGFQITNYRADDEIIS
jgi:type IV secretion system protein VirB8